MSNQDFTEHWPARCLRFRSYDHMALEKFDYSSSSSFFVARSEDSTNEQRHRSWGLGVLTLCKYVGGVRVCFDPPKMSLSFIQNCCWITLQVSHHEGWKTCQKWKVKLIFRGSWNSFAYFFTTDLRHCERAFTCPDAVAEIYWHRGVQYFQRQYSRLVLILSDAGTAAGWHVIACRTMPQLHCSAHVAAFGRCRDVFRVAQRRSSQSSTKLDCTTTSVLLPLAEDDV